MKKSKLIELGFITILCILLIIMICIVNHETENFNFYTAFLAIIGASLGVIASHAMKYLLKKEVKDIIYINCNINDNDFSSKLIHNLKKDGFNTVKEDDIVNIGETWSKDMEELLKKSNILMVIVSKHLYKNKLLKDELNFAKKNNISIIPILKDNVEIPTYLQRYKPADFRVDFNKAYENLLLHI